MHQLCGTLLANALHSRHIVRGITHDGEHIDDLRRRAAELLLHRFFAFDDEVDARLEDVVQCDTRSDQLHQVLVARDDHDFIATRRGLCGERSNHIVRFKAAYLIQGDAIRTHHIAQDLVLVHQLFGHLLARGLVVVIAVVTKGLARRIKGHADGIRLLCFQKFLQSCGKSVHGADRLTLGCRKSRALQREVRAIGECGAVEQEDACHREQDTAWK